MLPNEISEKPETIIGPVEPLSEDFVQIVSCIVTCNFVLTPLHYENHYPLVHKQIAVYYFSEHFKPFPIFSNGDVSFGSIYLK